ncbi:tagaturonate reductase [Cryobacterium sp. PAMC25264]|uniref:tagaturonate reductase n=1 Tax=Cryobacterium sp. PAMC25264 TaxID=2861288 RepID=UPI001C629108|nr:tagaturonate reductase [Cryobacterium sp. PAMC25264]QYF72769.1 tagaturonate reductase [Cryobacterium sp. PAMC25264]
MKATDNEPVTGVVTLPVGIRLVTAKGDLPAVEVFLPAATALVYLHGAHVAEWTPAGQKPVLWMSESGAFTPTAALRGGIPVCFPWFGPNLSDATAPNHGWARISAWTLTAAALEGPDAVLTFELAGSHRDSTGTAQPVSLRYTVRIGATLSLALTVRNDGAAPVSVETAFHTYFAVADARGTTLLGLQDLPYLDRTVSPPVTASAALPVAFTGAEIDRVYPMPRVVTIDDTGNHRSILVGDTDAAQTVVWNPGSTKAAAMGDFGDEEWTQTVCVEACNVQGQARVLAPGAQHRMGVTLSVEPEPARDEPTTPTHTQPHQNAEDPHTMERLTRAIHPSDTLPTRAIQFGEGNFLRAFVDWQLQQMNTQGLFNGGVTIVQPLAGGLVAMLEEQDNLYTVLLEGKQDGEEVQSHEVMTVVTGTVNPYVDYEAYLALAENDDIEFIFSNTTESGIVYSAADLRTDAPHASFPGKLTALLYRRFELGKTGFTLIPCELIEHNGDKLKETVLATAAHWELGDAFTAWVNTSNTFYSSLVDRIVPGYPKDRAEELCAEFGFEDRLIVKAEPFLLWVLEGPQALTETLPLAKAGLNVTVTDDMTPYRERKVFLLNAPHTTMASLARLAGVETVRDVMLDPDFGPLVHEEMYEEIIPVLDLPHDELAAYAESVKERFENPFMHHELASIALNSASKYKSRLLPILLNFHTANGTFPPRVTLALSAILLTYSGDPSVTITPVDSAETIAAFHAAYAAAADTDAYVATILADTTLWGTDLTVLDGLVEQVATGLTSLRDRGVRATLADLTVLA